MIYRFHYRGHLAEEQADGWETAVSKTKEVIAKYMTENKVMTACIYRHENMLFAYYETIGEKIEPDELFAPLENYLLKWPGEADPRNWVLMHHVYYHAMPESVEDWKRDTKPDMRRGRIARLKEDKLFDYVYYHVAITKEGYLSGDKYQSIGLHEDMLFSYFEEPRSHVNICRDSSKESEVIKEWEARVPSHHFVPWPDGKSFLFIPAIIDMG